MRLACVVKQRKGQVSRAGSQRVCIRAWCLRRPCCAGGSGSALVWSAVLVVEGGCLLVTVGGSEGLALCSGHVVQMEPWNPWEGLGKGSGREQGPRRQPLLGLWCPWSYWGPCVSQGRFLHGSCGGRGRDGCTCLPSHRVLLSSLQAHSHLIHATLGLLSLSVESLNPSLPPSIMLPAAAAADDAAPCHATPCHATSACGLSQGLPCLHCRPAPAQHLLLLSLAASPGHSRHSTHSIAPLPASTDTDCQTCRDPGQPMQYHHTADDSLSDRSSC